MSSCIFSIIIPCYKQAQYLSECLDSVLAQTYGNWECIIVDDGSPDNTREIAMPYCEKDNRFKYLLQENRGVSAARNYGIQQSHGQYILPLDADDYISADYLKFAYEHFADNPTTKLIYSWYGLTGSQTGIIKDNHYDYSTFIYENQIFCSCIFSRSSYDLISGGYDENMKHGYEDWEFLLSLLKENDKVYQIPQVCFFYRIKESSRNTDFLQNNTQLIESLEYIYQKHSDLYTGTHNPLYTYSHIAQAGLLRKRLAFEQERVKTLSESYAFRLGNLLMKPLLWLKGKKK